MADDELRREIVAELTFDWLAFGQLAEMVARRTGEPDPLATTVAITVELIHRELIRPGILTERGFAPWPGTSAEQATRLRAESQWYPSITDVATGDICWFDVTNQA